MCRRGAGGRPVCWLEAGVWEAAGGATSGAGCGCSSLEHPGSLLPLMALTSPAHIPAGTLSSHWGSTGQTGSFLFEARSGTAPLHSRQDCPPGEPGWPGPESRGPGRAASSKGEAQACKREGPTLDLSQASAPLAQAAQWVQCLASPGPALTT